MLSFSVHCAVTDINAQGS